MPKTSGPKGKKTYSKKAKNFISSPEMKNNITPSRITSKKKEEIPSSSSDPNSSDSSSSEEQAVLPMLKDKIIKSRGEKSTLPDNFLDRGGNLTRRLAYLNQNVPHIDIPKMVQLHLSGYKHSHQETVLIDKILKSPLHLDLSQHPHLEIKKLFPIGVAKVRNNLIPISPFAKQSPFSGSNITEPPLADQIFRETFGEGQWISKDHTAFFVRTDSPDLNIGSDSNFTFDPSDEDELPENTFLGFKSTPLHTITPFTVDKDKTPSVDSDSSSTFDALKNLSLDQLNIMSTIGFNPCNKANLGRYTNVLKETQDTAFLQVTQPTNFTAFDKNGKMTAASLPIIKLIDPQKFLAHIPLNLPRSFEHFNKRPKTSYTPLQVQINAEIFARFVELFKFYVRAFTPLQELLREERHNSSINAYMVSMHKYANSIFRDLLLAHNANRDTTYITSKERKLNQAYQILRTLVKKLPVSESLSGDFGNTGLFHPNGNTTLQPKEFYRKLENKNRRNSARTRNPKRKATFEKDTKDPKKKRPKRGNRNRPALSTPKKAKDEKPTTSN